MSTIRIKFASTIANEAFKNPELITSFINIVADECSNVDLIRIHKLFFEAIETVNNKWNLKN